MSDRKLRSGTRKDYSKMNDVNIALEEDITDDGDACATNKNKRGQQQHGDDGEILN